MSEAHSPEKIAREVVMLIGNAIENGNQEKLAGLFSDNPLFMLLDHQPMITGRSYARAIIQSVGNVTDVRSYVKAIHILGEDREKPRDVFLVFELFQTDSSAFLQGSITLSLADENGVRIYVAQLFTK